MREEIGRWLSKKMHFGLYKKEYTEAMQKSLQRPLKAEGCVCEVSYGAVVGGLSVLEDLKESSRI